MSAAGRGAIVNTRPKIISSDTIPQDSITAREVPARDKLDELLHSGYVVVPAPETASTLWLEATRARPGSQVSLSSTSAGYRVEISSKRFV